MADIDGAWGEVSSELDANRRPFGCSHKKSKKPNNSNNSNKKKQKKHGKKKRVTAQFKGADRHIDTKRSRKRGDRVKLSTFPHRLYLVLVFSFPLFRSSSSSDLYVPFRCCAEGSSFLTASLSLSLSLSLCVCDSFY